MRKYCFSVLCIVFLILLSIYSADCANAVRNAMQLCLFSAIPSLFPFFAASSLAISCGLAQDLGKILAPCMRTIFHLPGCGASALILGFLGGYPSGVRMASELYQAKLCSKEEANAIACCCNNTGPAFLIGMCGSGLFGSLRVGIFLYLIHIISALMVAWILRPKEIPSNTSVSSDCNHLPFFHCLIQSVLSAGKSCLMVSAFILFFSVVLQLLRQTGVLCTITAIFAPILYHFGLSTSGTQSLFTGCMELTQGLAGLTPSAGTIPARLIVVSFLCAFGGISVLFQTAAAAEHLNISHCILGKCMHALLAALLCFAMLLLFPSSCFLQ